MTRIAWATGAGFADSDADLPLLTKAVERAGIESDVAVWDDPTVAWEAYDLVVVRSCWDYVPRREEFLDWARSVPRLQNTADVLAWTTDKTYLRLLAAAGIAIVPTQWSVRGGDELVASPEWVVKPTISAGSADTARWSAPAQVVAHSEALLAAGRSTMVQPYVRSVDSDGETGMLFFGGAYSHAFRKGALLVADDDPRSLPELKEDIRPRDASPVQIEFGLDVLAAARKALGTDPLYARVDVVADDDGSPRLMELELAEPSFFLDHTPAGADTFVAAVQASGLLP